MAPKFKVGDKVWNTTDTHRNARVLYVGSRLYVLEAEADDDRPAWEYAETHRFIEQRYEIVPPKWEVGKTYQVMPSGAKFRVTAVDPEGHALGMLLPAGGGEWNLRHRDAISRDQWEELPA